MKKIKNRKFSLETEDFSIESDGQTTEISLNGKRLNWVQSLKITFDINHPPVVDINFLAMSSSKFFRKQQ